MRKFLLTIAIIFTSPVFVFSQGFSNPPCIISYNDTGLITPYYDSLPCIESGLPYSSSVQLSMPAIFNSTLVLDSLVITSITGLPAGIMYAQNPSTGVYYGDSSGCIAFAGTTTADSGAYQLTFNGYAVVTTQNSGTQTFSLAQLAQIQDAPVPVYYLNIIHQGDSCFPKPVAAAVSDILLSNEWSVYPNPAKGVFNLELNTNKALSGTVEVTDVTGRTVYSRQLDTTGFYKSSINLGYCAGGLYLLQVKTNQGTVAKSISVQ